MVDQMRGQGRDADRPRSFPKLNNPVGRRSENEAEPSPPIHQSVPGRLTDPPTKPGARQGGEALRSLSYLGVQRRLR